MSRFFPHSDAGVILKYIFYLVVIVVLRRRLAGGGTEPTGGAGKVGTNGEYFGEGGSR